MRQRRILTFMTVWVLGADSMHGQICCISKEHCCGRNTKMLSRFARFVNGDTNPMLVDNLEPRRLYRGSELS